MVRWLVLSSVLLPAGCRPDIEPADTDPSPSATSSSSSVSATSAASSTASATSSADETATTHATTTAGAPSFSCPPAPDEQQCNPHTQDCPEGFKCILWAERGNPGQSTTTVCAAVSDEGDPLYAECEITPGSCTDSCAGQEVCMPFVSTPQQCLHPCSSHDECGAGEVCNGCGTCSLFWCLPTCDPLAPECPAELPTCALSSGAFQCTAFTPGEEGLGDPCDGLCAPGLHCTLGEDLAPPCDGLSCCTELCDLDDPVPACTVAEHECVSVFEGTNPWPGQEHVGLCRLPL